MKNLIVKSALIMVSGLACLSAMALPLSEYNVFVSGDFTHNSSSIGGKAFIGGNFIAKNSTDVGVTLTPSSTLDSLVTVGNIKGNGTWFNVQAGNVVAGGSVNKANFNFNGGGTLKKGDKTALTSQRDSMTNELKSASSNYSAMTNNGNLVKTSNLTQFNYTGNDSTAIFNVKAADVFRQNASLNLNAGSASTVIINVSTARIAGAAGAVAYDFTAPGGINFTNGFQPNSNASNLGASNILWNFFDATELSLQGMDTFRGSLLAMGANIMSIGTADGSIAAKSLIQSRQIHNYTFVPPTETPLPASVQFLLMGMAAFIGLRRWRKKAKTV
ncbi:MAG: choice-of-anchor A family protein [Marinagarivorans sp.]|nr:choice-of-anchor A family protein [Marinagarivorans sp.]